MDKFFEVRNLEKEYEGFKLSRVSFSIEEGTITGLIGENGAGKSTTINAIFGAVVKTGGEVLYKGRRIEELEASEREELAVSFDEMTLPGEFKLKHLEKYGRLMFSRWDQEEWERLIGKLELPRDRKLARFSKGMKAKVQIAFALSRRPSLLVLDESTSSLDPVVRDEILEMLQDYIEDGRRSVLFSSHLTGDLEKIADRIIFLSGGKKLLELSREDLEEEYGILEEDLDFSSEDERIIAGRRNRYSREFLIRDRKGYQEDHPDSVISPANLEKIMLIMSRKEEMDA